MHNIAIQSLLRIKEVQKIVGLSRASIYRLINAGSFPAQVKLSDRASAWYSEDIYLWMQERIRSNVHHSAWHTARGLHMLPQQVN